MASDEATPMKMMMMKTRLMSLLDLYSLVRIVVGEDDDDDGYGVSYGDGDDEMELVVELVD